MTTVGDLWDLRADPAKLDAAANAWRHFAREARASHKPVDQRARALQASRWAGDTADTYQHHRTRLGRDVDDAAGLADQIATALDGAASALRRGQQRLTEALRTQPVPVSRSGSNVVFAPRTPAEVALVNTAVADANDIRNRLDRELAIQAAAVKRTRAEWVAARQAWNGIADGVVDPFTLPAEAVGGVASIAVGNQVVVNTGPADDKIDIRVDPVTGEQIVAVNGQEHRFPAGSNLTVRAGDGSDEVTVAEGTRVGFTLLGGEGDDILVGGDGDDTVLGLDGADGVAGAGGNDDISLGAGRDPAFGSYSRESAEGGAGDDRIYGSLRNDQIRGEAGDDRVFSGEGDDYADGGDGNDTVAGGAGTDHVHGGRGRDHLYGGAGRDYADGGAGDDHLDGGLGNDVLYGLSGDDRIHGGAGDDHAEGGTGRDEIDGGLGRDVLSGGRDDDTIRAGAGDDTVYTGHGADRVDGGDGQDTVYSEGNDTVDRAERTVTVPLSAAGTHVTIAGSPEFTERVQADLDLLRASPRGQLMLAALDRAYEQGGTWYYQGSEVVIRESTDGGSHFHLRSVLGHQITRDIGYNPGLVPGYDAAPVVALFHEMNHAYTYMQGLDVPGRYNAENGPDRVTDEYGRAVGVLNSERQAVGLPLDHDRNPSTPNMVDPRIPAGLTENGLREEMGVPPRQQYGR